MSIGIEKAILVDLGSEAPSTKHVSNFIVFFDIICAVSVGSPAAMGYVFKLGGWISGLWIIVTFLVSWYTGVLLIECLYYKRGERLDSFPDIGEAAFGKVGRITLQIFHYSIILSVSALFIKLAGITLQIVTSYYGSEISVELCMVIVAIIIATPYALANNMKELTIISVFGMLIVISIVTVTSTLGFLEKSNLPEPKTEVISWRGIPSALGTVGFAYGGNIVFPHIEVQLSNKSKWRSILGWALATVTIFYLTVGLSNYSVFGESATNPIFLILKSGLANNVLCLALSGHIMCAVPFYLISLSSEVEHILSIDQRLPITNAKLLKMFSRIVIVALLTVLAISVPNFEPFMALVGAINNLVVVYISPVILHLKLFGIKRSWIQYILIATCFCLGILGGILGIVTASYDMLALIS